MDAILCTHCTELLEEVEEVDRISPIEPTAAHPSHHVTLPAGRTLSVVGFIAS